MAGDTYKFTHQQDGYNITLVCHYKSELELTVERVAPGLERMKGRVITPRDVAEKLAHKVMDELSSFPLAVDREHLNAEIRQENVMSREGQAYISVSGNIKINRDNMLQTAQTALLDGCDITTENPRAQLGEKLLEYEKRKMHDEIRSRHEEEEDEREERGANTYYPDAPNEGGLADEPDNEDISWAEHMAREKARQTNFAQQAQDIRTLMDEYFPPRLDTFGLVLPREKDEKIRITAAERRDELLNDIETAIRGVLAFEEKNALRMRELIVERVAALVGERLHLRIPPEEQVRFLQAMMDNGAGAPLSVVERETPLSAREAGFVGAMHGMRDSLKQQSKWPRINPQRGELNYEDPLRHTPDKEYSRAAIQHDEDFARSIAESLVPPEFTLKKIINEGLGGADDGISR